MPHLVDAFRLARWLAGNRADAEDIVQEASMRAFKGIPYAEPPLGALRFDPPRPAKPWKGVLDASAYRSACPQVSRYGLTDASDDADCLYLNVTVPAARAAGGRKRPVIVWVHGGAYIGGSSNLYPLEYFSRTGDVVIMDNLSPHKSTQTIELIQHVGAQVLFLPPYSPDLNPVEKMWSKLKEFLRSKEARSLPTLIEAIGLALERITPRDAINWLASSGYSFI